MTNREQAKHTPVALPATDTDVATLVGQIKSLLAAKDYTGAERLLDLGLMMRPEDTDFIYYFGQLRGSQGRFTDAEEFYRKGLAINPQMADYWFCLGQILAQTGRAQDGVACFREAIKIKPNFAEAHVELGLALSREQKFEEAVQAYRSALRLQPNLLTAKQALGATLIVLRRPKEAEALAREALLQARSDNTLAVPLTHNLAIALSEQRRYNEALAIFERLRVAAPGLPLADYNRGNVLLSMGRLPEAAGAFKTATERNPLDLKAHFGLNQLLYRFGAQDFLCSYAEASALLPDNPALYAERARLLFLVERYEEATEFFARALHTAPDNIMYRHGLALSLARAGKYAEAAAEFDALSDKADADILCSHAELCLRSGDAKKARVLAAKALAQDPLNQLAFALENTALRALDGSADPIRDDYESLVGVYDLDPPEGFADMASFNRKLEEYLAQLHLDGRLPNHYTGPLGTRSMGALFGAGHELVEKLRPRFDEAVRDFIAKAEGDPAHPFRSRRAAAFRYSESWSTRLKNGGFHANHVHPRGWISSAYYVGLPDVVADETERQGWLKFGEPPFECGLTNPVQRFVKPVVGRLVLFPSYLWHGTTPFISDQTRTGIAFDVEPGGS